MSNDVRPTSSSLKKFTPLDLRCQTCGLLLCKKKTLTLQLTVEENCARRPEHFVSDFCSNAFVSSFSEMYRFRRFWQREVSDVCKDFSAGHSGSYWFQLSGSSSGTLTLGQRSHSQIPSFWAVVLWPLCSCQSIRAFSAPFGWRVWTSGDLCAGSHPTLWFGIFTDSCVALVCDIC